MSDQDLVELRNTILREVYEAAEPGLDFDDLLENPDEYPGEWYDNHYLSPDREQEIFDKHTEDVDLNSREHADLVLTCTVSLGPSNSVEDTDE